MPVDMGLRRDPAPCMILAVTVTKILHDASLEGLLAAVAKESAADGINLSNAVRRDGCESVVLDTGDWIVRFPRRRDDAQFDAEIAVLAHVRGRLPVETPDVAWTGEFTRCMAYPKITGTHFIPQQWNSASEAERLRLAGSLAELLIAWRELFTDADINRLGVGSIGGAPYLGQVTSTLPRFPDAVRPQIRNLLDVYDQLHRQGLETNGPVLLHGDFHLGNMVLDGTCGAVTGLWDFSCVATGAFAWDLHYLTGEVSDPADDLAPPGTGQHLDLLSRVIERLPSLVTDPDTVLVLSDLMQCAEWIGDHEPDEAVHWQQWLSRLGAR